MHCRQDTYSSVCGLLWSCQGTVCFSSWAATAPASTTMASPRSVSWVTSAFLWVWVSEFCSSRPLSKCSLSLWSSDCGSSAFIFGLVSSYPSEAGAYHEAGFYFIWGLSLRVSRVFSSWVRTGSAPAPVPPSSSTVTSDFGFLSLDLD